MDELRAGPSIYARSASAPLFQRDAVVVEARPGCDIPQRRLRSGPRTATCSGMNSMMLPGSLLSLLADLLFTRSLALGNVSRRRRLYDPLIASCHGNALPARSPSPIAPSPCPFRTLRSLPGFIDRPSCLQALATAAFAATPRRSASGNNWISPAGQPTHRPCSPTGVQPQTPAVTDRHDGAVVIHHKVHGVAG